MVRVICIAALAMLAACPGDDDDDGAGPDGPIGDRGMRVNWATTPTIPGTAPAASVSVFELELSSLRVVGDAGDSRTTATSLDLVWSEGVTAAPSAFPDAPAGRYARVDLGTGGDDERYHLRGQVVIGAETLDYRIDDETPLSISLPIDVMVAAGARTELAITIDVAAVLDAVPFESLERDGDELQLEAGDPEIAAVRAAMAAAFSVAP